MIFLTKQRQAALGRLIADKNDTIYGLELSLQGAEKEIARLHGMLLATYRATRDLADGFLYMQEEEMDMSEDLEQLVSELSDQICQLEEHYAL